jgi:hypothetical protein
MIKLIVYKSARKLPEWFYELNKIYFTIANVQYFE